MMTEEQVLASLAAIETRVLLLEPIRVFCRTEKIWINARKQLRTSRLRKHPGVTTATLMVIPARL